MTHRFSFWRTLQGAFAVLLAVSAVLPVRATIGVPLQAQLGNPSGATTDAASRNNYLIARAQYALGYNDTTREPNWVAWNLTTGDVGSSGRSSSFFPDTTLPTGFTVVGDSDYSGSGYDRGHMCPSGDRTVSRADNDFVFYMTNMIPQAPDNNQGVWNNFETYCRSLASAGNEVLIICGPSAFGGSKIASGVSIAGYTWKIVVVVPLGSGTALSRVTASTRVIAIRVPNIQGVRSNPWQNYVTSVAAIEAETGYNFFSALPAGVAATLRLVIDGQPATGAPVITAQPTAQTAPVGGNATFAVTATGNATLTYQWAKDDTDLPGETEATLSLTNVQLVDAGNYSVTVTNSVGSVTSSAVALVLSGVPPTITTPPVASTVMAGSTATFSVVAGGSPTLTYQWRKGTTALTNGGTISGATGATLTITNAQAADAGSYDVVVTNGTGTATSSAATLTVNAAAPTIVTPPVAQAVTIGATATLTVLAKGTEPLSYQWRKGGSAIGNGGTISGATTASLVIASAQVADAGSYDVVVSNGQNPDATSTAAVLTVSAATGQLAYTGGSYAQNFDTLPTTGTFALTGVGPISLSAAPINAAGLAGWTIAKIGGTGANAIFNVGTGSSNTGSVYAFGTGATTERALGAVLSGAVGSAWGLVLVNNTGQTITQFTVGYTGEQWRYGGGTVGGIDKIAFEYQVGGSDIATGTFTAASALDFTSRVNSATAQSASSALDGNAAANRAAITGTVTGLTWNNGQTLVLRWKDNDVTGSDDGLAIDDFTFSTDAAPVGTAPAVASTTPAGGATAVNPATPITVTFNQAVTTTGQWFAINSAKNGAVSAAVSGGPTTFTLSPPVSFADNDTVTVAVLAGQVADQATGTLRPVADATWSFTTVAPVAPVITTPPVAQTVAAGGTATFTVVATGTAPIGYQWRKNTVPITGNGTASTATLTLTNVQAAEAGDYDVVVSNGVNPAATSTAVALAVTPSAPTIMTPPIAQAVAVGTNATFSVVASGTTPFSYQWRKGGADLANGGPVAGATSATLTLTGVALADAGNYDVVVSNGVGTPATSTAVALTVNAPPQATIAWDFTTAAPTSGLPGDFSGGVVTQGNNNGTTTLLTTVAASSGYTGFSAGNNAGAAARVGALDKTAGTGSAYFEFTLTPVAGKTVNATSLSFGSRSSGTGPLAYAVYTSVDNFAAPVATGTLLANSTWSLHAPVFTPVTGAVSAAVTLRIYGYNGAGSAGVNNANWRIDDLKLGVNVGGGGGATTPSITTPPAAQTVAAGANVTFTVVASGGPTLIYQWRKAAVNLTDGATVAGATTATLTLSNVQAADAGTYDVVVSNGAGGSVTSAGAVLTVSGPTGVPVIATPPVAAAAMAGGSVTLSVGATGPGPLSYQWRKDGNTITGATGATLALTNLAASAGGNYSVVVTNATGSTTSAAVPLNVIVATQSVAGPGYVAGSTVTIFNALGYGGTLAGYGWQLLLPAGWSYASGSGSAADTVPAVGATGLAEWQWTTNLGSPAIFTATLNVPMGAVGAQTVSAIFVGKRVDGSTFQVLVQPDALTIHRSANFHHSDTNQDGAIGLTELTRVIELYNTRNGTTRTGKYRTQGGSEDGFAPGP